MNETLRVSLTEEGYLRVTDLRSGEDVFRPEGGAVALVLEDKSDTWSHEVAKFEKVIGQFEMESSEVVEHGPVRGRLRARYRFGESTLRLDFTLGAGEAFVGVEARVDWREKWRMLKLAFGTGLAAATTTAEVPGGTAVHPADGTERPMQQWVEISNGTRGAAIANNGKHGYSAVDGEVRVSVLRSPPFAYYDAVPIDFEAEQRFTDQGVQEFRLAIIPHAGDWRAAAVIETARQLNRPPICLAETFHGGKLPASGGFIEVKGKGVIVSAVKPAERGRGWIIRAGEWFGRKTKATFALPTLGRRWAATFAPHQLKTFFVPEGRSGKVREVNLIEE